MTTSLPRLSFSHDGQHFTVKSRPTEAGVEVRGFWRSRSTARTRFVRTVPPETIQGTVLPGAPDPVVRALELVRDDIITAIDRGEPLGEGTGP